jgi:hypothetical protein
MGIALLRTLVAWTVCGGILAIPVAWMFTMFAALRVNRESHEATRSMLMASDGILVPGVRWRVSTFGSIGWGVADLYVVASGLFVAAKNRPFVQYVRAGSTATKASGVWALREVRVVYEKGDELRLVCANGPFDLKVSLRGLPAEVRERIRALLAGGG